MVSDTHTKKPLWKKAFPPIFFISLFVVPLLIFKSCEKDLSPDLANVALQINGKTYMYTINKGIKKSVPLHFISIFKDDDKYFVQPNDLKTIINAMGKNVDLHEFKQASHDGYFTNSKKDTLYKEQSEIVTTKTIGEEIKKYTVTIGDKANKSMKITWSHNIKKAKYIAGENCEMHSFWIKTSVQPGETSISTSDFLVVSLHKLAKFYGCTISYDNETRVLFISR